MPTFEELFSSLQVEILKSEAISSTHINLSSSYGFFLREVALFEQAAVFDKLDEKEKPTGETFTAPLVTLNNGKELRLSEDEAKIFNQIWNVKTKIDTQKLGIVFALDALQNPVSPK